VGRESESCNSHGGENCRPTTEKGTDEIGGHFLVLSLGKEA
jgi:hypothetical protein